MAVYGAPGSQGSEARAAVYGAPGLQDSEARATVYGAPELKDIEAHTAVFVSADVNDVDTYSYLAEFKESREAYQFAGDMRGSYKYNGLSIILEDVWRDAGIASKKMVKQIFTPEGVVIEADEDYWQGKKKEDWWVHGFL